MASIYELAQRTSVVETFSKPNPYEIFAGKKLAIFDLDGTVYSFRNQPGIFKANDFSESLVQSAVLTNNKKILVRYNDWQATPEKADEILDQIVANKQSVRKYICQNCEIDQADYYQEAWNIDPEGLIIPRPHLLPLLNQIKNDNIRLFLITKAPKVWQQNVCNYLGISSFFEQVYTGDIKDDKYDKFMSIINWEPYISSDSILTIGDSFATDIEPFIQHGVKGYLAQSDQDLKNLLHPRGI